MSIQIMKKKRARFTSDSVEQNKKQSIKIVMVANQEMIHSQGQLIQQISRKLNQQKVKTEVLRKKISAIELQFGQNLQKNQSQILQFISLSYRIKYLDTHLKCTKLTEQKYQNEIVEVKNQLKVAYTKKRSRKPSIEFEGIAQKLSKTVIFRILEQKIHKISLVMMSPQRIEQIDEKIWINQICRHSNLQYSDKKTFINPLRAIIKKKLIPHKFRNQVWPILIEDKLFIEESYYRYLKTQIKHVPQKIYKDIKRDIERTFTQENLNVNMEKFRSEISQILYLFYLYRPEIGYVQGMIYPLIVLKLNLDMFQTFKAFCNIILCNQFVNDLFRFKLNRVQAYCRALDRLLDKVDKKLFNHLKDIGIISQNYLIQWFYTFFRKFELEHLHKIWDMFLIHSHIAFFKISLMILLEIKYLIIQTDYSTTLNTIKDFYKHINQSQIIQKAHIYKLSQSQVATLFSEPNI